jgi:hypothetical protein
VLARPLFRSNYARETQCLNARVCVFLSAINRSNQNTFFIFRVINQTNYLKIVHVCFSDRIKSVMTICIPKNKIAYIFIIQIDISSVKWRSEDVFI